MKMITRDRIEGRQIIQKSSKESTPNKDATVESENAWSTWKVINAPKKTAEPNGDYLARLNLEQLRAVRYGIKPGNAKYVGPLLIIAGAGTGKTTTLAARAAHLVVNGIDPGRILLLTFTRRAAADMKARVRDFTAKALKGAKVDLSWAGTFHSVGARLLREYAHIISLNPAFTILDQGDAEDLMNLVRQELGLSQMRKRFPEKATCLSIYSHVINSRTPLDRICPNTSLGALSGSASCAPCLDDMCRPSANRMSSIMTICCYSWIRC
jgi:hypothetical protein